MPFNATMRGTLLRGFCNGCMCSRPLFFGAHVERMVFLMCASSSASLSVVFGLLGYLHSIEEVFELMAFRTPRHGAYLWTTERPRSLVPGVSPDIKGYG